MKAKHIYISNHICYYKECDKMKVLQVVFTDDEFDEIKKDKNGTWHDFIYERCTNGRR